MLGLITMDNKFQQNFCIYDEYVINLFVCIKNYLALVLKLCYTKIFYEIDWNIILNGGLNKKLNTVFFDR